MRISLKSDDAGYALYWTIYRIAGPGAIRVHLDGMPIRGPFAMADEEAGEVVVADRDETGRYRRDDHGRYLTRTLRGQVEIRFEKRSVGPDLP